MQVLKLHKQNKKVLEEREFILAIERIKIADFRNAHFRTRGNKALKLKPTDIFELSFDKKNETKPKRMTPEEVERKFGLKGKK